MNLSTKKLTLILFAALFARNTYAQSWNDVVNDRNIYLFGEGVGNTMEAAQEAALADLTGKISTFVASSFDIIEDEKTKNGDIDASTYISSKVQTYSNATLTNTEHFEKEENDEWHALRFIKRDEVEKIFAGRRLKVEELVWLGENAEKEYKVGDALKFYYWAFTLLKTLQYPDEVRYTDMKGVQHVLATYLPAQIDNVLGDIRASVSNRDNDIVELFFTFRGHPVVNMDYTYNNGYNYSNIYSAKDGRGNVELTANFNSEYLQLKVEYVYHQDAKTYCPEVSLVQDVVRSHSLRKAAMTVPMAISKVPEKAQSNQDDTESALVELTDDAVYRKAADSFVGAIRSGNHHSIDGLFTPNGLQMYNQLLKYGTARIQGEPEYKVYRNNGEVVVRSIPMSFSFKQGARKSIVEDVVLCFDSEGKINHLSFALDNPAVNDIVTKGVWSDTVRQTILSFLEDYKTAYCLERTEYLNQIFSDDALIIVGHVLKTFEKTNESDRISYKNNKLIKKTQYTKDAYIKHLDACFKRNECINIHFADNDIMKAGKGNNTFGIQIKQDYYSTTYGDSGYLFLMVDFNNPAEPTILVRVWQEEPDPEFGLANLNNFQ